MTVDQTLRDLNEAAYAAARSLCKANDPRAERARKLARETDMLLEGWQ